MLNTRTFTIFANYCRMLAVGASTLAARDKYLDMAMAYECQAEASSKTFIN
jgi:hypothetical protein